MVPYVAGSRRSLWSLPGLVLTIIDNDAFRTTMTGGRVMITAGVDALK